MHPESPNPELLFAVLSKHGVDAVLVGGLAVFLHGGTNITTDSDIAFRRSPENLEKLANALEELQARPVRWKGAKWRLEPLDLVSGWLHLTTNAGPVDLLAKHPGITYDQLSEEAVQLRVNETEVIIASVDSLIQMKEAAGRDRDHVHLEMLNTIKRVQEQEG